MQQLVRVDTGTNVKFQLQSYLMMFKAYTKIHNIEVDINLLVSYQKVVHWNSTHAQLLTIFLCSWQSIATTNNISMYVFYDMQLEVLQLKFCVCLGKSNFETMKCYCCNCCKCGCLQISEMQEATAAISVCMVRSVKKLQSNVAASNFTSRNALQQQTLYVCKVATKQCSSKQL